MALEAKRETASFWPEALALALGTGRLAAVACVLAAPFGPGASAADALRNDRCARLGDDFAAVAGSDACVRIGGHVRADLGHGGLVLPTGQDGFRPASEAYHIRARTGWTDLYQR